MKLLSKINILLVLSFVLVVNSKSQSIDKHIEMEIDGGILHLTGSFDFSELPKPLLPVRVDYTFEIKKEMRGKFYTEDDWDFHIRVSKKDIELLDGENFVWKGPHSKGDAFSGTFDFIPLTSGNNKISIGLSVFEQTSAANATAFTLSCCFDHDGILLFLGNHNTSNCNTKRTTFFNQDSILIKQRRYAMNDPSKLFRYNIQIQPTFRVGDTSTIQYRFNSYSDYENGIDLVFESYAMDIISLPEKIDYPIKKDQCLEIELKVVPRALRTAPRLWLFMNKSEDVFPFKGKRNQQILVFTIFNDDGSLKVASDQTIGRTDDLLPTSFSKYDGYKHNSYRKVINNSKVD